MAERAAAREAMGGKLDRAENNDLDDRCLMRNAGTSNTQCELQQQSTHCPGSAEA